MADNTSFPGIVSDLPSRGWFYPKNHPLATGKIELFYMTARHEDILVSRNLIEKGTVIDVLLKELIADKAVNYDDLLMGDRNQIMIASRILAYGKEYESEILCRSCEKKSIVAVDLETLKDKQIEFKEEQHGINEFWFDLPISNVKISFKLLTVKDDRNATREIEGMRKMNATVTPEVTTRMAHSILSVDGNRDQAAIRKFIQGMPSRDSRAFRNYAKQISPDVDFNIDFECSSCGNQDRLEVPIDVNFFWPDARISS